MPTVMTHAVAGVALGALSRLPARRPLFWALSAVLPMLPDLDVIAYRLGVGTDSMWGHRGITHSLVTALVVGTIAGWLTYRRLAIAPLPLIAYCVVISASHGLLDSLTHGVPGVAFLAPLSDVRVLAPWAVFIGSPIGLAFFSARGLHAFARELVVVWLPSAAIMAMRFRARL